MSVFVEEVVACPACGEREVRSVAHSVNGERSPHLREAILAGDFQQVDCGKCQAKFEIGHPFIYSDRARKQWIGVFSRGDIDAWQALEREAVEAWEAVAGAQAPDIARELFAGMRIRTVFGRMALREKLLCDDLGLDELVLELMKIQLALTGTYPAVSASREVRLLDADAEKLHFLTGEPGDNESASFLHVPRAHYHAVEEDAGTWEPLLKQLVEGSFVDAKRVLVDGDHAPV